MDDLARFIVQRVKCALHPYIPPEDGWRRYPPHMAKALEYLEPLHIIAIGPTWVGVDGAFIDEPRSLHEKYDVSLETVEAIFGEAVDKSEYGNLAVRYLSTGITCLSLFWGSVWYIAPCVDLRPYPSRFAYKADSYRFYCAQKLFREDDKVEGVVATVDGVWVGFEVSKRFFLDPKPENARLFGDLLFLAQMGDGWIVDQEIDVHVSSESWRVEPYGYVALVLQGCPGIRSFLKHAYGELLLRDAEDAKGWRLLAQMLESSRQASQLSRSLAEAWR